MPLPGTGLGLCPAQGHGRARVPGGFHEAGLKILRPRREAQKSFIFPSNAPVAALQELLAGSVRRIAKLAEKQGADQHIATVDQVATLIERIWD